jgi:hypothetical protein
MARPRKLLDPERLLDGLDWLEDWNRRQSPFLRIPLGLVLCAGGLVSILPLFGLWMLPVGLLILSEDIPWLRDRRERFEGWLRRLIGDRRARRQARLEHKKGY